MVIKNITLIEINSALMKILKEIEELRKRIETLEQGE